jgi:hypothetical protein
MNRSTLKIVVVAFLAATAIVAVAGSVDDARIDEGGGSGSPPSGTVTETSVEQTTGEPDRTITAVDRSGNSRECVPAGQRPLTWVGAVGALGIVVGIVYRQRGRMPAIAVSLLLLVFLFLGYSLFGVCTIGQIPQAQNGSPAELNNETQTDFSPGDGTGDGSSDTGTSRDFPLALVAVVAVLAVAAVGAVLVSRDTEDDDPFEAIEDGDAEDEEGLVDVDEFAAAAGRAADRIEDTDDVDNEIYRAWVEMTTYLDVPHPESSTPGEFAAAAVDAGIDRDDVVELTDLFERVRYGHTAATSEREDRALDALRRIEAQYGGEDA